ncbi:MAG TPA: hypothetical protein VH044_19085 [Polyangiaceae bacterium]|jgi:hypothetical protein|nr:hypothetical protein [Polyangiaceae bacterium]
MRTAHALLATVAVSLCASAGVAGGARAADEAIGTDARRDAQATADGGSTNPQPGTPIYPGPAPGVPGSPPGANPGTPPAPPTPSPPAPIAPPPFAPPTPALPPGASPGNNPGVNPGAVPGNPGNAPGMNPGAGHGTPGTP